MDRTELLHDLSLMVLYLGSWIEGKGVLAQRRAWKSVDFDVLDQLRDEGLTYGSNRAKSVYLTGEGVRRARELLAAHGMDPGEGDEAELELVPGVALIRGGTSNEDVAAEMGELEYLGTSRELALVRCHDEGARCLQLYEEYLCVSGLDDRMRERYLFNASLFINVYLSGSEPTSVQEGVEMVGGFLGEWYVHKCPWASRELIREAAVSVKRFYHCMLRKGLVTQEAYDALGDEIQANILTWYEACDVWRAGDSAE